MTDNSSKIQEIKDLSFEEALKKLEDIVSTMEGNDKGLDRVISDYEYGVELKKHLQHKLSEAKLKISKISEDLS